MQEEQNANNNSKAFVIHCLYSSLPMDQQQKIFEKTQ